MELRSSKDIDKLPLVVGQLIYCQDDGKNFIGTREGWRLVEDPEEKKKKGDPKHMTLYDLNRSLVNQLEPITHERLVTKMIWIDEMYQKTKNKHYMLMCKEFNYYTIFDQFDNDEFVSLRDAVYVIISELGVVYDFDISEENNVAEIWIKPEGLDEPLLFHLFPYDQGVVYYA